MQRRTFVQTTAAAAVLAAFASRFAFAKGEPAVTFDPLTSPWTGPHGGFPRFDKIKPADFAPAIDRAMTAFRADLAAIASRTDAATFDNTIAALEDAGRGYNRATGIFGTYKSTMSDKPMQKLEEELAPKLAAFDDEITQNAARCSRAVKAVFDGSAPPPSSPPISCA